MASWSVPDPTCTLSMQLHPPPPLRPLPNSMEESESNGPVRWQMHPAPVLARQGWIRETAFLRGGVVHYLPSVVKCNAHVASSAIAVRFVHEAHAEVMDGSCGGCCAKADGWWFSCSGLQGGDSVVWTTDIEGREEGYLPHSCRDVRVHRVRGMRFRIPNPCR